MKQEKNRKKSILVTDLTVTLVYRLDSFPRQGRSMFFVPYLGHIQLNVGRGKIVVELAKGRRAESRERDAGE